jgi:formate dehydrogenase subunit gamma
MGCNALETHLQKQHGLSFNETAADGSITLEPVYCLGNCACAPSVLVDGEVRGRVTSEKLDRWIQELRTTAGGNP